VSRLPNELTVSVIVPSYKRAGFLRQCLSSLLGQSHKPDQIVVVVRPEDKETYEVAQECATHDRGIVWDIVWVDKDGVVAAENKGLKVSWGDIVCFIDDDAIAEKQWIEHLLEHYQDVRVGAVGGPVLPMMSNGPVRHISSGWMHTTWLGYNAGDTTRIPSDVVDTNVLRGCNMSFRRQLMEPFDTRLRGYWRFEDDMVLTVLGKGYRALCSPRALVYHYAAPVQVVYQRHLLDRLSTESAHHNNTYVFLKHHGFLNRLVFLAFTFLCGDPHYPGLLMFLAFVLKKRNLSYLHPIPWSFRGKWGGIQTYRRWRAERNARPTGVPDNMGQRCASADCGQPQACSADTTRGES